MDHVTVLRKESVDFLLKGRNCGVYIDATLGGGGTSEEILSRLKSGRVLGVDRDPVAIEKASLKLNTYSNFTALRGNFSDVERILMEIGITSVDGVIFDLGVSSMQLGDPLRGFSFRKSGRLDMRMDPDTEKTAFDLVKNLDWESLRRIFKEYGEERWAGRIASRIVEARKVKPIETTAELAKLVEEAIPRRFHPRRIHPATKVFQALRIAVNEELENLKIALEASVNLLKSGGRVVVISYHSLEDRIVKHFYKKLAKENILKIITKKPFVPADEEIRINPRCRSAKMRVAEKL